MSHVDVKSIISSIREQIRSEYEHTQSTKMYNEAMSAYKASEQSPEDLETRSRAETEAWKEKEREFARAKKAEDRLQAYMVSLAVPFLHGYEA